MKKAVSVADKPKTDNIYNHIGKVIQSYEKTQEAVSVLINNGTVLQLFDTITDSRKRPGSVQYPLNNFLMLVLLAIVYEGCSCPHSIADHIWLHSAQYAAEGLLPDANKTPSHDTVEDLLSMINPEELNNCLIDAVYEFTSSLSSAVKEKILDVFQFDGKELAGTGLSKNTKNPSRNTNMVNMYSSFNGICLKSIPADSKSNEKPVVQYLLNKASLKRRWVSFDALHTSEINLEFIGHQKGWYLAPIKSNQKNTLKVLEAMFSDPKTERFIQPVEAHDREFKVLKLTGKRRLEKFPSAKLALKMISRTRKGEEPTVMYFITNSSNIERAVFVAENRWEIENMHKLKDSVLMDEDAIQIKNKTAQTNLVILNNFIAAVTRIIQSMDKKLTLARAKKLVRGYPIKCFKLVCGMISDQEFRDLLKAGLKKEALMELTPGNLDVRMLVQKE